MGETHGRYRGFAGLGYGGYRKVKQAAVARA
jgi:hypothetical protein